MSAISPHDARRLNAITRVILNISRLTSDLSRRSARLTGFGTFNRALEGIPRQKSAFHPRGKSGHTTQRAQRPQLGRCLRVVSTGCAHHHVAKSNSELLDLIGGLSLDQLSHHRCRSLRDGAAAARESEIGNLVALDTHVNHDLVPA